MPEMTGHAGDSMLEVISLRKDYTSGIFLKSSVTIVDDVSFHLKEGETLGIAGESGSGKSTLGQCILRLIEPTSGQIYFKGTDITALDNTQFRKMRQKMQMIFQDPDSSLDPRMTIGQSIAEPLKLMGVQGEELSARVSALVKRVGLLQEHISRYPHQLSGGQNQRAVIARTIAIEPEFIVADEPTASLDVSVQAQILNLLKELKQEFGLTMIFISHDLELLKHMCDRVAVMYQGKIVEEASVDEIFAAPQHPYTQTLLFGTDTDKLDIT